MARLIDAEHLKKWILARWERIDPRSAYPLRAIDIIDQIDREDTIEAEPVRHGHWKRKLDTRFGEKLNDIIGCSECNIYFSTIDMIRRSYCPNCGAKMDSNDSNDSNALNALNALEMDEVNDDNK